MQSIRNYLRKTVLTPINHTTTERSYKRYIDYFYDWTKTQGLKAYESIENQNKVEVINNYVKHLQEKELSASTIHTYIAPICKGFDVPMSDIQKPLRKASTIRKTRIAEANLQGKRELLLEKNSRIVEFQKVVGIRRAELVRLTGEDLLRDRFGRLCVRVKRGKGGKEQYQHILPKDESIVIGVFRGVEASQRVFSDEEVKQTNHAPFHALRALQAREAYKYYLDRIKNGAQEELTKELMAYFETHHPKGKKYPAQRVRFENDIKKNNGRYYLRGDVAKRAMDVGAPIDYNRLALMCVSVFHLAHWRLDVTVKHYML